MNAVATRSAGPATRAIPSPRPGRAVWLLLIAFVVLGGAVKAPQVLAPMGQDQGLYHTIGEEILQGAVPYRDAWDPKPPAAFYTHAALLALMADPWRTCQFGPLPGLGRSALQPRCGTLLFEVVDYLYSLLIAGLVFAVARRLGLSAWTAAIAFGLTEVFVNLVLLDPEGSTPEKYALGPAVAVLLAGLTAVRAGQRRWLMLSGVLGAVAVLYKQPDGASFAALTVWLLMLHRGRDLLWLWAPFAALLAIVAGAFALAGAGAQFLEATVGYNLGRFGFQSDRIPLRAIGAIWQIFRDGTALLWLLGATAATVAWRAERYRLLMLWATFDVLTLGLGGTKFTREYFLQLVPSCSLLAAIGLHDLWTSHLRTTLGRTWLALSLLSITLLTSGFQTNFTLRVWNEYVAAGWTTTSVEQLATMIRALPPEDTLYVWGDEGELYPLSGRLPTTRFLNTAGIAVTGDAAVTDRRAELFSALRTAPPAVIVVDRRTFDDDPDGRLQLNLNTFPELRDLLARHYQQMDPTVLASYLGGDRELVYVRQDSTNTCAAMPGCRLF